MLLIPFWATQIASRITVRPICAANVADTVLVIIRTYRMHERTHSLTHTPYMGAGDGCDVG